MATALIIGAGGQDGRLLAELLQKKGYAVAGWVRAQPPANGALRASVVNILQPAAVETALHVLQPDEIYYLAAFHHATEEAVAMDTAELLRRSFDVQVTGLINTFQALQRRCPEARVFYAASSHAFGKGVEGVADEKTPFRPDSAYGMSKLAGMRCCQLLRRQDGIFASTGILFHHDSALRRGSFVSQKIVRAALQARRDPSTSVKLGNLNARVDWGYAPDYVDAMFRILQLPEPDDFVVASGELHTVGEFVEAAFAEVGRDWRDHVVLEPGLIRRDDYSLRGDSEKLRAATGWSPSRDFKEFVATLVRETETVDAK